MGLFSWLKPEPRPSARAPSADHPTPHDAIYSLVEIDLERGDCGEWITFHAANGSREAMIQTAQRTINLVSHELDLPSFLLKHGEQEISQKAVMGGRKKSNASLWEVQSGTPSEVARVVDLVFEIEFGLGRGYSVDGSLGH